MFSMQAFQSSPFSGDIKLLFLALAVLVVLAETSSDGWARKCSYGMGRCRKTCKELERKKEKCGGRYFCCIPGNFRLSDFCKDKDAVGEVQVAVEPFTQGAC
ncbi:beta-defensin 115 [Otolemur garnettii]|uniref:beta-defensin 115 n=1 Tax=Otolemur garnettii TaxID=30611 RepID=UPI000C7F2188|nr:beta-defensin 115 [Otolemur garnettii]